MRFFFVITCHNVFNAWPKTPLLPVWRRDAKRLATPGRVFLVGSNISPLDLSLAERRAYYKDSGGHHGTQSKNVADFMNTLEPETTPEYLVKPQIFSQSSPVFFCSVIHLAY